MLIGELYNGFKKFSVIIIAVIVIIIPLSIGGGITV